MTQIPMTRDACPRCLDLARRGAIAAEMLQRMPAGAFAPRARDGSGPCCFDCASADGLTATCSSFGAARLAVGNDRVEHYRLPPGMEMGLVAAHRVRAPTETMEQHHAWLDDVLPGWFEALP